MAWWPVRLERTLAGTRTNAGTGAAASANPATTNTPHRTNTTAAGEENGKNNPDVISSTHIEIANDLSERRFHNVVVTIHLFAAFLPGLLQLIWNYFGSKWTAGTNTPLIYVSLIVFINENHLIPVSNPTCFVMFHIQINIPVLSMPNWRVV